MEFLSELDGKTPSRRVGRDSEMLLAYPSAEELTRIDGIGCFGQEVLVGKRRSQTARASKNVETLIVEKANLLLLFRKGDFEADLRRVCTAILDSFIAQTRLATFKTKMRRSAARIKGERDMWAAYTLQLVWRTYKERDARANDELYKLIRSKNKQRAQLIRGRSEMTPKARPAFGYYAGWEIRRGGGIPATPPGTPPGTPPRSGGGGDGAGGGGGLDAHGIVSTLVAHLQRLEQKQDQLHESVAQLLTKGGKATALPVSRGPPSQR